MKHLLYKILYALCALILAGCQAKNPLSGPLRVRIPLDDGNNNYSFREVELKTVKNLASMSGDIVEFRTKGSFEFNEDKDLLLRPGFVPAARFIQTKEGVYVPTDYWSTALAAGYYHFEKIKEFFDQFGSNEGLQFPRTVIFDLQFMRMPPEQGGLPIVNNAFYIQQMDILGVSPYVGPKVPVVFNGGVLAHEYTHSIFYQKLAYRDSQHRLAKAFDDLSEEEKNNLYKTAYFIRGFDEGIADFFAAEYSGNPKFHEASFDLAEVKDRNAAILKNFDTHSADPHHFGARVASFLWKLKDRSSTKEFHQTVWSALDHYLESAYADPTKTVASPSLFGTKVMKSFSEKFSSENCLILGDVFKRFLKEDDFKKECPE